jgi:hypothetical protein
MKIDGRCHCGYVRFEAEADPETTTICNCTDCQTMSGAPLRAIVATRPGTFMLLSGKLTEYRKTADSGNVRLQAFCLQQDIVRLTGLPFPKCLMWDLDSVIRAMEEAPGAFGPALVLLRHYCAGGLGKPARGSEAAAAGRGLGRTA